MVSQPPVAVVESPPGRGISRRTRRIALGVLGVLFVAGAVALWQLGVTPSSIRDWLDSLGPAAPILFVFAFVVGSFIGLPGMAFVIGGRLAFGPYWGFLLGYGGGLLAVTIPFVAARKLRPQGEPWRPKRKLVARVYALLDRHPFRAVLLLRLVLWFNPPLSYALAFSQIRLRTYVTACAVALAPVVTLAVIATSWLL